MPYRLEDPELQVMLAELHQALGFEELFQTLRGVIDTLALGGYSLLTTADDVRFTVEDSSRLFVGAPVCGELADQLGARLSLGAQGPRERGPNAALPAPSMWRLAVESALDDAAPVSLLIPLTFQGTPYGFLVLHEECALDEERRSLVGALAAHLAAAYVHVQVYTEASREANDLRGKFMALTEMGELLSHLDREVLLTKILELGLKLVHGQVGALLLRDRDEKPEIAVEWGLSAEHLSAVADREGRAVTDLVLEDAKARLITDFSGAEYRLLDDAVAIDSFLCVPLPGKHGVLGCLCVVNPATSEDFSAQDFDNLVTIGRLAAIAVENAALHAMTVEQERMRRELDIARQIQQSVLPARMPKVAGLEIAAWNLPYDETGGDYYDVIASADGRRMGLAIGDVSGHGLGAALVMMATRAGLRALLDYEEDLTRLFARLNDLVEADTDDARFMTLLFGWYDADSRRFRYVSAGHDEPLHYRAADGRVEFLSATGPPLGMIAAMEYDLSAPVLLAPGDVLLLCTDGVWEAMNAQDEAFGRERLAEALAAHAHEPIETVLQALHLGVQAFCGQAPLRDDYTLVILKAT